MMYFGGKSKIAKELAQTIANRHEDRWLFVEPFAGGGSMTAALAPHFSMGLVFDIVPDLILLRVALQNGWEPPDTISEQEYHSLRTAAPSALRAIAGFGQSFGGKFFGGYARGLKSDGSPRNYAGEARRSALKFAEATRKAIQFSVADYRSLPVIPGAVAYCDPPYANTTGYSAAGTFNSGEFWRVMREWRSGGMHVYVSEYNAPQDWEVVWEKTRTRDFKADTKTAVKVVERLYA